MIEGMKSVAGLRVRDPKTKTRPIELTLHQCPRCCFLSPLKAAVKAHIKRQHEED